MNYHEAPLVFECAGCRLVGIAALPEAPAPVGVLIIVGGPQYRAGSHRQFTLLARDLAQAGYASLRFDYRGMGDSEGEMRNFEAVDEDVRSAVDALIAACPGVQRIVLWGLCDAASAALFYAHTDPRVQGLVLLNPWVHTEAAASRSRVKHYYLGRLLQRSFWEKLFSGQVNLGTSAAEFAKGLLLLLQKKLAAPTRPGTPRRERASSYIERMLEGLTLYQGPALLILSGNDLTAQEFQDLIASDPGWKAACASDMIEQRSLAGANHTFSSRGQRGQVSSLTLEWLDRHL